MNKNYRGYQEGYPVQHRIRLSPIHLYLIDKGLSDEEIGALTLDELEEMLDND